MLPPLPPSFPLPRGFDTSNIPASAISYDSNPFFNAPPMYHHRKCGQCHLLSRRDGKEGLHQCRRCGLALYCSKECQKSNWPIHKADCNKVVTNNATVQAETGLINAVTDFKKWFEYYKAPMQNCVIAALNLPVNPHQDTKSVLVVTITHKGTLSTEPVEHRFKIDSIERWDRGVDAMRDPAILLDHEGYHRAVERGKIEDGPEYYGTGVYFVICFFSPTCYRTSVSCFQIDNSLATAHVVRWPGWKDALSDYFEKGNKMRNGPSRICPCCVERDMLNNGKDGCDPHRNDT